MKILLMRETLRTDKMTALEIINWILSKMIENFYPLIGTDMNFMTSVILPSDNYGMDERCTVILSFRV